MFALTLLSYALLATSALARPSGLSDRLARRAAGSHLTRPLQRVASPEALASNTSHVEYSSNWAGAVYDTYPSVSLQKIIIAQKSSSLVMIISRAASNPLPVPSPSLPPRHPVVARELTPPPPGLVLTVTPAVPPSCKPVLTSLSAMVVLPTMVGHSGIQGSAEI